MKSQVTRKTSFTDLGLAGKCFLLTLTFLLCFRPMTTFSYPKSDHYDGEVFFNPNGAGVKSLWELLKWQATKNKVEWPATVPIKNYPLRLLAPDEKVSVTWINHATFLVQLQGLNILTDPVYSDRSSPSTFAGPKRVREPGLPFDSLPPIDVVVISHNHYDHLDLETIRRLDAKFHPLFLIPLGDERLLERERIQNVKALDWWQEVKVKETRIVFTPAQHWSARHLWDKNESLWGSWLLENNRLKVYFAGDTGLGPHFKDIKARLGAPDIALLPIGAYKPRWFMQDHHMDPEEAVQASLDLAAVFSIGMHFGTFQLSDEGIEEPERDLKLACGKHNISEDKFRVLDQGQTFVF